MKVAWVPPGALLLGLLLGSGVAAAQSSSDIYNYGSGDDVNDCQSSAAIAGTAGYRNARAAITTNAQTYGAATYARRYLFPLIRRRDRPQEWEGGFTIDNNVVFGATRVPSIESGYPFGDCPAEYRVSMRALDLGASNFGYAFKKGRFGVFYSGALTWSAPAAADNRARGIMTGSYVIYGGMAASVAPLLGGLDYEAGIGTASSDWIGGVSVDTPVGWLEAGYVGSSGFFGDFQEANLGLFGSALVKLALKEVPYFKAGADRIESPGGLTSVYARRLPLEAYPAATETGGTVAPDGEVEDRLETGHLEQRNIGGQLDLVGSYAWQPRPAFFDGQVAFHSRNYWTTREEDQGAKQADGTDPIAVLGAGRSGFLLQGGFVNLPAQWYLGLPAGTYGTARVEFTQDLDNLFVSFRLMWNDPELLALYPYARDGVWLSYRIWGAF